MDRAESGRLGGVETSFRYGAESLRCSTCGHLSEKSEFHVTHGSKGGRKVVKLYGTAHMSHIGKLGGRGKTREKRLAET